MDGATFLLASGRNPEIALLIEARREDKGQSAWFYGLARISAARLSVKLDDRKVADLPKPVVSGWRNPCFVFDRPAPGRLDCSSDPVEE